MSAFHPLPTLPCAIQEAYGRRMPLTALQFWSLIGLVSGVGCVTYLLNRSGRQWGWYFLVALIFLVVGTFAVWSAFDFASGRRGGLTP
jgi:hypothetical protein